MTEKESLTSIERQQIVSLAKSILSGSLGLIQGCRLITKITGGTYKVGPEKFLLTFIGIESETDHLPADHERSQYSEADLLKIDAEIRAIEQFYRPHVHEACRSVIAHFSEK